MTLNPTSYALWLLGHTVSCGAILLSLTALLILLDLPQIFNESWILGLDASISTLRI